MTPAFHLADFLALSPLFILFSGSLLILLLESFFSSAAKKYAMPLTLLIIALALIAAYDAPSSDNSLLTSWIRFDPLARFFNLFFLSIGFGIVLISPRFHGEYFFLILSSLMGLLLIGASADLLMLFLGIEALSIPLYILCGFIKKREISHESALKYFLTGALATSFFVYGIALIYGASGTTKFYLLLPHFQNISLIQDYTFFYMGIAFVSFALLFKAAVVPFHQWAPDVYGGAPTPVTAYMAVAIKAGAFTALFLLFSVTLPHFDIRWNQALSLLAQATLIYANFVALRQTQLRRFFAYSGIAQAGFLLIPLVASTEKSQEALLFYLIIYALATLGCFAVLNVLDERHEGVRFQDLGGLFKRSPPLCILFSLCLLTLAGLPPTAGFLGKFLILKEAFQAGYIFLALVGLLASILSIYYYLRPIALMLGEPPLGKSIKPKDIRPKRFAGYAISLAIVLISLFPAPLWNYLLTLR